MTCQRTPAPRAVRSLFARGGVLAAASLLGAHAAVAQIPVRVVVTPATVTLEVGTTVQLTATALGRRRDTVAVPVRWTSLDPAKARVSITGVVLARDTGVVTIVAAAGVAGRGAPSRALTRSAAARITIRPAVLVGAGDIADCDLPGARKTAELLDRVAGTVFTAGDNAYPNGTSGQFASCYEPTWGRHKARTRPTAGNHDYRMPRAAAYFGYFGASAGDPARGFYAYDLGGWRVYALNSGVAAGEGSEQAVWLREDLAMRPRRCVLAYWHHARFSSGPHGSSTRTAALFQALYDAGADVVIVGHDHDYERFAPQTPSGRADAVRGIRQFVVGTGGGALYEFGTPQPNSEFRHNAGWGVLRLTLYPRGYAWEFLGVDGGRLADSGTGSCH